MTLEQALLVQALSEEKFRAWLGTFGDCDHVGAPLDRNFCPIAKYLQAAGRTRVSVDEHMILADFVEVDTPPWGSAFVKRVDRADHAITAGEALQFLGV